MNGYSLIFMAAFIVILAAVAGVLSWGLMRSVTLLSHRPQRWRGPWHS